MIVSYYFSVTHIILWCVLLVWHTSPFFGCVMCFLCSCAIHTYALCSAICRFTARLLNGGLESTSLCALGKKVMGKEWSEAGLTENAKALTLKDIDGSHLFFPDGCKCRPYKRILCFLAHLATKKAKEKAKDEGSLFKEIDFDDFWSEADDHGVALAYKKQAMAAVQAWMDRNI